jgi:hypothetical protein
MLLGAVGLNSSLVGQQLPPTAPNANAQPANGQEPAQRKGTAKSQRQGTAKRLFVDSIVASVNDSSILQSKLFQASEGDINGREAEGGRMSLDQIQSLTISSLRSLVSDYEMAQSARSFGNFPPERFDAILNSELERDKQDRVRELGTDFAVSEELARTGETWQTRRESMRIEKLTRLAKEFAIHQRLNKQSNLYLTPRMLRETYQRNRSLFVRDAAANVAIIEFYGANAEQNATAAVQHWRTYNWTAAEIAAKFGPEATAGLTLPARSLDRSLKTWALAGPANQVSDPISIGRGNFKIAKIMEHITASDGQFEDPLVQAVVRRMARDKVLREFTEQAQQRARNRSMVWVYENGNRRELPMR